MRKTNSLTPALMLVAALGWPPLLRAAGTDAETFPPISEADAQRLREAGEALCRDAATMSLLLGERFREIGAEMSQTLAHTGTELAHELAPTMRRFAAELDRLAREMEQRSTGPAER